MLGEETSNPRNPHKKSQSRQIFGGTLSLHVHIFSKDVKLYVHYSTSKPHYVEK